ncbi:MAG: deoxyguanosinetriphosphate triphosphohydrolase [Spirochaetia bacterium]|nr:deoxyguanosinetriphosphate triphosphohydrolase [Spirochaetia bacterium]
MNLALYAVNENQFIERKNSEKTHKYRSEFQRDRDRIVHSKAFRRLEYKTQVFVNHWGDNFRTRLTHSIEVSQIARTVARSLGLNEDLTETIALAHDLGHPPFGHAGERGLHKMMKEHGGFDHNDQSLRVVEILEQRYPNFDGLNLTKATLMGLQKHKKPGGLNHSLEAQVVDLCDEIAYNNHDLDDGIETGILKISNLNEVEIWADVWTETSQKNKNVSEKRIVRESIRQLINKMVTDLIENTKRNIEKYKINSVDDVLNFKNHEEKICCFSSEISLKVSRLKKYLYKNLYRYPDIEKMNTRAEEIIHRIFNFVTQNKNVLPPEFQEMLQTENIYRVSADFIAGMTDRYALSWNKDILGLS